MTVGFCFIIIISVSLRLPFIFILKQQCFLGILLAFFILLHLERKKKSVDMLCTSFISFTLSIFTLSPTEHISFAWLWFLFKTTTTKTKLLFSMWNHQRENFYYATIIHDRCRFFSIEINSSSSSIFFLFLYAIKWRHIC